MGVDIAFFHDDSPGWAPITYLGELSGRLLGGKIFHLPNNPTRWRKLLDLRKRQTSACEDHLIAILRNPHDIDQLRALIQFRSGYRSVAVWIIDSFHHAWTPREVSLRDIDVVAVMRPNDEAVFARVAPRRTIVLGWGSDVLNLGCGESSRTLDVLRLGRQPEKWDDDSRSKIACQEAGLSFAGRPPSLPNPLDNQRAVMRALSNTRYVIAHSNLAAPASYTHRTEEYITARWTDALACGAIVAGVQPRGDKSMERLLWSGAVLDFDRIDLKHNIAALTEARAAWRPENAERNHKYALARLDWRWRLKELVERIGLDCPPALMFEIRKLEIACGQVSRSALSSD
jgi:hypothetical protein